MPFCNASKAKDSVINQNHRNNLFTNSEKESYDMKSTASVNKIILILRLIRISFFTFFAFFLVDKLFNKIRGKSPFALVMELIIDCTISVVYTFRANRLISRILN